MPKQRLAEYRDKRDLRRTPEPGDQPRKSRAGMAACFVVQKHAASSLHYDFRLEAVGVLKSWAVPKGPSTNPDDKRLAVPTEDHPLAYADFEGPIPDGQYGAGAVIVWDTGTYENLTVKNGAEVPVEEALNAGHVKFRLHGEKLYGVYALTRTRRGSSRNRWLLVKLDDEDADRRRDPVRTEPTSVLSGKTIQEHQESGGAT